jgi:hypothetical protein
VFDAAGVTFDDNADADPYVRGTYRAAWVISENI